MQRVESEFGVNNMKAWFQPALLSVVQAGGGVPDVLNKLSDVTHMKSHHKRWRTTKKISQPNPPENQADIVLV